MIPKLITSESFDFGDASVRLVPLSSRGIDRQFVKRAGAGGVFDKLANELRPQKGRTVIHVLAVGDEENYGPNRNADGFSGEDNRTAHTSFKDHGHVYRNHQSDDPLKAVGDVIATAHNELMHRVELMLSLDDNKCRREVQAVNEGRDVPVSMGSLQKYDVCSYCGHKAPTAPDHCEHIKNQLGLVAANGQKIYMKNPNPRYFDISLVFKPADRIAYTLRKVAEAGIIGGHVLAEQAGLTNWASPKYAVKRTLATLIKQVPAHIRGAGPGRLQSETVAELKKQAQLQGIDHLLAFLSANGWLLGPHDLGAVSGLPAEEMDDAAAAFGQLDQVGDEQIDSFEGPSYWDSLPLSGSATKDLHEQCSMTDGPAQGRIIKLTIIKQAATKTSRSADPVMREGLGRLYGHYKLSFAMANVDRPATLRLTAASW